MFTQCQKKPSESISAVDDVKDLEIVFIAIPTGEINVNNDSVVDVRGIGFFIVPAIIIVIVEINMLTAN
jgi:hypothetical protein